MNKPLNHEQHDQALSPALQALVHSVPAAPEAAVEHAQQRLLARVLARAPSRPNRARRWLAVLATSAAAVMVLALLPLFSGRGDAFAAIQQRLRSFNTLVMHVSQRHQGAVIQTSTIRTNAQGVVRTDVGSEISIIVDPQRGRVLTLLHEQKHAMLNKIPINIPASASDDALSWLAEIRDFKGKAKPLPDSRMIAGHAARGWALTVHGMQMELWADSDGWPLTMRMAGKVDMAIEYRFEFDQVLAPALMSSDLPAGYEWMEAEND